MGDRLAYPVQGHSAVVRPCGAVCRRQWKQGRPGAVTGRSVPAAYGHELCGEGCGGADKGTLPGEAAYDHRPDGESDGGDTGQDRVSVPEPVLGRLSFRRLFQHAVVNVTCGDGHG